MSRSFSVSARCLVCITARQPGSSWLLTALETIRRDFLLADVHFGSAKEKNLNSLELRNHKLRLPVYMCVFSGYAFRPSTPPLLITTRGVRLGLRCDPVRSRDCTSLPERDDRRQEEKWLRVRKEVTWEMVVMYLALASVLLFFCRRPRFQQQRSFVSRLLFHNLRRGVCFGFPSPWPQTCPGPITVHAILIQLSAVQPFSRNPVKKQRR
jgi:hypothetical protein